MDTQASRRSRPNAYRPGRRDTIANYGGADFPLKGECGLGSDVRWNYLRVIDFRVLTADLPDEDQL